jgi:hypothetical protein
MEESKKDNSTSSDKLSFSDKKTLRSLTKSVRNKMLKEEDDVESVMSDLDFIIDEVNCIGRYLFDLRESMISLHQKFIYKNKPKDFDINNVIEQYVGVQKTDNNSKDKKLPINGYITGDDKKMDANTNCVTNINNQKKLDKSINLESIYGSEDSDLEEVLERSKKEK